MDRNVVTEGSSFVPFETQLLRSSATYPGGDYAIGDLDESLDWKRTGADIESLEADAMADEDALSNGDNPITVKKDNPDLPSW
jgi:hypothetical protein